MLQGTPAGFSINICPMETGILRYGSVRADTDQWKVSAFHHDAADNGAHGMGQLLLGPSRAFLTKMTGDLLHPEFGFFLKGRL
jgi:hypothetical protein